MKCDVLAADHVVRFTRPSGSVFAYCKRSKTGAREGLGMRLSNTTIHINKGSLQTGMWPELLHCKTWSSSQNNYTWFGKWKGKHRYSQRSFAWLVAHAIVIQMMSLYIHVHNHLQEWLRPRFWKTEHNNWVSPCDPPFNTLGSVSKMGILAHFDY